MIEYRYLSGCQDHVPYSIFLTFVILCIALGKYRLEACARKNGWVRLRQPMMLTENAFEFTIETMRPVPSKVALHISLTFETAQALEDGSPTKTLISKVGRYSTVGLSSRFT